jgi:hypothetical protein
MMADEVSGTVQGNNGERLELKLGSKAFGLNAKDLLPILLLLSGLVGGYLLYTDVHSGIQHLEASHLEMIKVLHSNELKIVQAIQAWRGVVEGETDVIRKLLITHEWNMGRDHSERLPLELPPRPIPVPEKDR